MPVYSEFQRTEASYKKQLFALCKLWHHLAFKAIAMPVHARGRQ